MFSVVFFLVFSHSQLLSKEETWWLTHIFLQLLNCSAISTPAATHKWPQSFLPNRSLGWWLKHPFQKKVCTSEIGSFLPKAWKTFNKQKSLKPLEVPACRISSRQMMVLKQLAQAKSSYKQAGRRAVTSKKLWVYDDLVSKGQGPWSFLFKNYLMA